MKDPRLNIPSNSIGNYIEHGAIKFNTSNSSDLSKELEALHQEVKSNSELVKNNNEMVSQLIQLFQQQLQSSPKDTSKD